MSILITGGTKGIGLAIAKAFARESGDVFVNYHSDDAAARDAQGRCQSAADGRISSRLISGCAAIIAAARDITGRLDQIAHCAVDPYATTALDADPARFERAVIINGMSLLFLV